MEFKKRKSISRKSTNRAKSYEYFIDDFYQIEECDLEGIFNRLERLEKTVKKVVIGIDNNISGRDGDNSKGVMRHGNVTTSQRTLKNFTYDDYLKQLINFYFIYQYFYTTSSIFSINEYYECMTHFNGKIPEYLTCAIISKSILNYPCSQLHRKNLDYSNYYYELSIKYLNISMSKNEINIYMLYTLSILSWVDESLNRQFSRFFRIVTSTKLVQVLELDNCYFITNSNAANMSQFSLKKLLNVINTNSIQISEVFDLPKTKIFKELEFDCYQVQNEDDDKSFIDHNLKLLPKEYYLTFKTTRFYLSLKSTHINSLEKNLYSKNAAYNYQECLKLIRYINEKYCSLPRNVRYSKDCLDSQKIENSPLLNNILRLYQLLLRQISTIYGLLVKIINKSSICQIISLSQNISIFFDRVLDLLKDQQSSISKHSRNKVYLDSTHIFYYGGLLLDLITNLNQELNNRKCFNLNNSLEEAVTRFNSFTTLTTDFQSNWEGCDKILRSLTGRYKSIILIK